MCYSRSCTGSVDKNVATHRKHFVYLECLLRYLVERRTIYSRRHSELEWLDTCIRIFASCRYKLAVA